MDSLYEIVPFSFSARSQRETIKEMHYRNQINAVSTFDLPDHALVLVLASPDQRSPSTLVLQVYEVSGQVGLRQD